jgi:hypothetical protein
MKFCIKARTIVLLDDYTLMKDPNYEDDAQDWHIIHVDKVLIRFLFEIFYYIFSNLSYILSQE